MQHTIFARRLVGPLAWAAGLAALLWVALALPAGAQDLAGAAVQSGAPAVRDLRVTTFYTDRLELNWAPVTVTAPGGHYRIAVAAGFDGAPLLQATTPDLLTASYVVTGLAPGRTYYVSVRTFLPAHAGQPTDLTSAPALLAASTRADARVLVAVYFAADNDLSPYIRLIGERLARGTAANPNADVVFLADGDRDGDTVLWEIAGGTVTATNVVSAVWGTRELDTGDPAVLAWFLDYARTHYPADKTVVSLMGHGVALAPELAWIPPTAPGEPALPAQPGIPALPQGHDYTPADVTDGGYMSVADVGAVLAQVTDNGANPFDLLFFDQCFQGNLDILYEVRQAARVFVASPNYAWLVAPYAAYLPHFAPYATPEEMAQAVIQIYQLALNNLNPNAIFWVRSGDLPTIASAVSALGDALQTAVDAGEGMPIQQAALNSQFVDTTQCGRADLHLGPPDELLGAGSFASDLLRAFVPGDAFGVYTAASDLLSALDVVSSTHRIGHPYIDPTELWTYTDTLTILAPLHRDTPPPLTWRASIYRDTAPFNAIWMLDPAQTVIVSQTFAFVRDGRWDEFLEHWYTGPMTPTVGEWCNSRRRRWWWTIRRQPWPCRLLARAKQCSSPGRRRLAASRRCITCWHANRAASTRCWSQ